jgi:formate hydrogenlyase subunit 3/multisubunit Na+/H+ antiporter MnhD subunit
MNTLVLLVALPLIAAFLLPIVNRVSPLAARATGPLTLVITSVLGLSLWRGLGAGAVSVELGGFRPPLGIVLYADPLSLLFAVAVSLGTLLLWPRHDEGGIRQWTLTLVLAAAGSGLALSGDLFNIYVFYELLAVVSYGLITAHRTASAYAASLRYLVISSFGAALALTGIALVYQATGTLNLAQLAQLAPQQLNNLQGLTAFVLLLIGFGVKAELFPVNTWVPEVYASAPNRLSALLAGVVSKLALLVILRLLVLVFQQPEAHMLMLVLGVLGVISGELAAWRARDFNRMLAYSSIGQLGIVFIAFAVPGEGAILAGLAVALHHLIVKPALFLLAGRWGGSLAALAGAARSSPLAAILFIVLALSLVGVPPLPGFWAKLLVLIELAGQAQPLYYLGALVILAGAVLEAAYLFRIASSFYASRAAHALPARQRGADVAGAGLLATGLLASVLALAPLARQLGNIAGQSADVALYIRTVQPEAPP